MSAVLKTAEYRELLLGCGPRREKVITFDEIPSKWKNLTTLDMLEKHKPDVVHDLSVLPLPFADNEFDEIHAYEVLEHTGQQGDWKFFFAQFEEFWRILKPGGYFVASVPAWDREWAWADPGHTRIIAKNTLLFLSQKFYEDEVGKSAASDYRPFYKADFETVGTMDKGPQLFFVLRAKK